MSNGTCLECSCVHPADAAIAVGRFSHQGGMGEEPLVVATAILGGLFHGGSGPELGDIDVEVCTPHLEKIQCETVDSSDDVFIPLMTVAQHRRILAAEIQKRFDGNEQSSREHSEELAQHRQQAGKLVEALSACRSELHAMITAHNVQSEHDGSWLYDYQTVSEADEALADWEKTK